MPSQVLSTPLAGANTARRTAAKEFTPGTVAFDNQNRNWVYVGPATTVLASAAAATVTGTFGVNNTAGLYTNETDAGAGFAIGEYGWVRKTATPL
jgi:hypothetical protein